MDQGAGNTMQSMKRWVTKRNLFIASMVLVGLAIIAAAVFVVVRNGHQQAKEVKSVVDAANASFDKGDYGSSIATLEANLGKAKTDADKATLYGELASAYASSGEVGKAIDAYAEKHKYNADSIKSDAYALGGLYERGQNNAKALEQYRIALDYSKSQPSNMNTQADIAFLEARIKELGN